MAQNEKRVKITANLTEKPLFRNWCAVFFKILVKNKNHSNVSFIKTVCKNEKCENRMVLNSVRVFLIEYKNVKKITLGSYSDFYSSVKNG